uniref:SFRICE_038853 n=1 Tax=Spodoptera frugiperda TaxID=7108 RepID=A0A2H1WFW3_SPOFR
MKLAWNVLVAGVLYHHRWGPVGLMPDLELRTTKRVYWGTGSTSRSRNGVVFTFADDLPLKKEIVTSIKTQIPIQKSTPGQDTSAKKDYSYLQHNY